MTSPDARTPATRAPSKAWCRAIIAEYGSITAYICQERLGWALLPCVAGVTGPVFAARDSKAFADANNYRVEQNDWPYEIFGAGVTHLVVWLEVRLWTDPVTGMLAGRTKGLVEEFVEKMFVERLRREDRMLRRGCCGLRIGRRCRALGGWNMFIFWLGTFLMRWWINGFARSDRREDRPLAS